MGERKRARALVTREIRRRGLSPQFFSEVYIHLSLFLGYPLMLEGLEHLADIARSPRRRTLKDSNSSAHRHGRHILRRIYGAQTTKLLRHLDDVYPGLGHRITQDAYGLIMHRPGLTLPERELVNIVVLFVHGFDRQAYSHLRGAMRVGVAARTLMMVIQHAARISGAKPEDALATIRMLQTR
jgi:4-carboxymuconolactone decarboxylase